jgi:hypothetical protein
LWILRAIPKLPLLFSIHIGLNCLLDCGIGDHCGTSHDPAKNVSLGGRGTHCRNWGFGRFGTIGTKEMTFCVFGMAVQTMSIGMLWQPHSVPWNYNQKWGHIFCRTIFCAMETTTRLVFSIHIGLNYWIVESENFVATVHTTMQKMYHLVRGKHIAEIADLVNFAQSGQVCLSAHCVDILQRHCNHNHSKVQFQQLSNHNHDVNPPQLLVDLSLDEDTTNALESHIEEIMMDQFLQCEGSCLDEEGFIHFEVLDLLSQGGYSPTQIAQMRDSVVWFISQTSSHGSPADWLLEVQAVLDRNYSCPLLQIVVDNKRVHAIAAVNAATSVPESRVGWDWKLHNN